MIVRLEEVTMAESGLRAGNTLVDEGSGM